MFSSCITTTNFAKNDSLGLSLFFKSDGHGVVLKGVVFLK